MYNSQASQSQSQSQVLAPDGKERNYRARRGRPSLRSRQEPYAVNRQETFRQVRSNGPMKSTYFITVPRCDLERQYVFDGFSLFCDRLIVAKESHKLTYNNSCCENSSLVDYDRSKVMITSGISASTSAETTATTSAATFQINPTQTEQQQEREQLHTRQVSYEGFRGNLIRGVETVPRENVAISLRQEHCTSHFHIFAGYL